MAGADSPTGRHGKKPCSSDDQTFGCYCYDSEAECQNLTSTNGSGPCSGHGSCSRIAAGHSDPVCNQKFACGACDGNWGGACDVCNAGFSLSSGCNDCMENFFGEGYKCSPCFPHSASIPHSDRRGFGTCRCKNDYYRATFKKGREDATVSSASDFCNGDDCYECRECDDYSHTTKSVSETGQGAVGADSCICDSGRVRFNNTSFGDDCLPGYVAAFVAPYVYITIAVVVLAILACAWLVRRAQLQSRVGQGTGRDKRTYTSWLLGTDDDSSFSLMDDDDGRDNFQFSEYGSTNSTFTPPTPKAVERGGAPAGKALSGNSSKY
jgi:hypothetical protein